MRVAVLAGLMSVLAWTGPAARSAPPGSSGRDWPAYGGTVAGTRYSALDQINVSNVARLETAWTYDTHEAGGMQTQPIVVGRVLYGVSPLHKTFAVDAATGQPLWTFTPPMESRGPNRGVSYWSPDVGSRRGSTETARIFAAAGQYIYALDAGTGAPVVGFGDGGRIDLRRDLGRDPQKQSVRLTTPGAVYRDLLIVGGRVSESAGASPGDVRAYDVRTGKLRWTFHTIPRSGEPGADTWPKDAWSYTGGANNWAGMALDEARGLVFVPTGSAAADFYGADRTGDNLYANSLIALRASTGQRVWSFQAVHHDIWDRDFPSPPTLVTVKRDGRSVDAVAQTTKHGFVFLFQRTDGTLLFPVMERAFPGSAVEGEVTSRTQPVPLKPAPFARQQLTADMLTTRTPEAHKAAAEAFARFRNGGAFVPLGVGVDTVVFPGFDGGAEWGGSAFDPRSGVLYVNANEMAWTGALAPADTTQTGRGVYRRLCAGCHRDDLGGAPPQIPSLAGLREGWTAARLTAVVREGVGRMPGFPDVTDASMTALVAYLTSGEDKEVAG
ncbi:MAG TPA: c-type cytochrome, partial [Vicinamibacterales bacterium]